MLRCLYNLREYQSELVDAFKMEASKEDIRSNPEAKRLARYINRHGKAVDKILKLAKKFS